MSEHQDVTPEEKALPQAEAGGEGGEETAQGGMSLLDHLGEAAAAGAVREAVEGVLRRRLFTPDLGGTETTNTITEAVVASVRRDTP